MRENVHRNAMCNLMSEPELFGAECDVFPTQNPQMEKYSQNIISMDHRPNR